MREERAFITLPSRPSFGLHAMAPGARLEIFKAEAEQVVAFDNVGVALADNGDELLEHRLLVHLGRQRRRARSRRSR